MRDIRLPIDAGATQRLAATTPSARTAAVPRRGLEGDRWLALPLVLLLAALLLPLASAGAVTPRTYLIASPQELAQLPMSGAAWTALKAVADGSLGTADLANQDNFHAPKTFAAALVYARTGVASYRDKVRSAIGAAIGTENNAGARTLSVGRQLGSYVMAADLIDLATADPTADGRFRTWLRGLRTKVFNQTEPWNTLENTHRTCPCNWGAFAGASLIATSLYLGDATLIAADARTTRGFLGDTTVYPSSGWRAMDSDDASWTLQSQSAFTPVNRPAQVKNGVDLDGAIPWDISRAGPFSWPPGEAGRSYTMEAFQGLVLQAELLHRAGHAAYDWAERGLLRAARFVSRYHGVSGVSGWNFSRVSYHVPWLLNARYGLSLPTVAASYGRIFGFTDWLYAAGSPLNANPAPAPTAAPTTAPTATATPTVAPIPTTTPIRDTIPLDAGAPNVAAVVRWFPSGGALLSGRLPVRFRWSGSDTGSGIAYFEVSHQADGGAWLRSIRVAGTALTRHLARGHTYRFRVRAVDKAGNVGPWAYDSRFRLSGYSEQSVAIRYAGRWTTGESTRYWGGKVRASRTAGQKVTFTLTGRSVAWITTKGSYRGKAAIYVNGRYARTVDLYASSTQTQRVVWTRRWSTTRTRTIEIRVLGTSGRPRVDMDGFFSGT